MMKHCAALIRTAAFGAFGFLLSAHSAMAQDDGAAQFFPLVYAVEQALSDDGTWGTLPPEQVGQYGGVAAVRYDQRTFAIFCRGDGTGSAALVMMYFMPLDRADPETLAAAAGTESGEATIHIGSLQGRKVDIRKNDSTVMVLVGVPLSIDVATLLRHAGRPVPLSYDLSTDKEQVLRGDPEIPVKGSTKSIGAAFKSCVIP